MLSIERSSSFSEGLAPQCSAMQHILRAQKEVAAGPGLHVPLCSGRRAHPPPAVKSTFTLAVFCLQAEVSCQDLLRQRCIESYTCSSREVCILLCLHRTHHVLTVSLVTARQNHVHVTVALCDGTVVRLQVLASALSYGVFLDCMPRE